MSELESRLRQSEDREHIASLNHRYARLIDSGKLEAFSRLFADGTWRDCTGPGSVLSWLRENVRLYGETPRTNHLISALDIDIDGDTAAGLSTITVFLQTPESSTVSVITVNEYYDEYSRIDGEWWFTSRRVSRRLEGDMTAHVRDQRR